MLDNIYLDKTQINFTSGYTLTKQKLGGTYLGVLKIDVIKFDYERKNSFGNLTFALATAIFLIFRRFNIIHFSCGIAYR